jgi:hypothetical protein
VVLEGKALVPLNICLYFQLIALNGALATSDGHKVWHYLFTNGSYNPEVRPIKQWSTPTVVNVESGRV